MNDVSSPCSRQSETITYAISEEAPLIWDISNFHVNNPIRTYVRAAEDEVGFPFPCNVMHMQADQ